MRNLMSAKSPKPNSNNPRLDFIGLQSRVIAMGYQSEYRPELHYMRGPGPRWFEKQLNLGGYLSPHAIDLKTPTLSRSIKLRLRRWFSPRLRTSRSTTLQRRWNPIDQIGPWLV
jgi:hypothetical protein